MEEIERKFLVKKIPSNSKCIETIFIEQGYISSEYDIRIRKETRPYQNRGYKESHYMIIKSDGNMIRREKLLPIKHDTYMDLIYGMEGNVIEKLRKKFDIGNGLIAEVDEYKSIPDLVTVEVEFETEEQANNFIPPEWFGKDITNEPEYKNKRLAMR